MTQATLRDGTPVCIRAVRADDKQRLNAAFERLSAGTIYHRFFHPKKVLTPDELRMLTELDPSDHISLAVTVDAQGEERFIAVGRIVRVAAGSDWAELGITVADEYQQRGAGTLLLQRLIALAGAHGIREVVALVLDENRQMLEVIANLHLPTEQSIEDGAHRIVLKLGGGSHP